MASVRFTYSLQCCGDNSIVAQYTSLVQLNETYYYDNNDICWSIVPFQTATTAYVPTSLTAIYNDCGCYSVENTTALEQPYQYQDCEGVWHNFESIPAFGLLYVCGRQGSVNGSGCIVTLVDNSNCNCVLPTCSSCLTYHTGVCPTPLPSPSPTATPYPTPTTTPSLTPTITVSSSSTPTPSVTATHSPTPSITPTNTITPTTTTIVCGSGVTTSNINYYFDCCGTLVQNTASGTTIIFDYTKSYNGVSRSNIAATQMCASQTPTLSPSQTPTPSITPSITPTNTLTPSITPSITPSVSQSGVFTLVNNCTVFTLFDMGIECVTLQQPSSASSIDGILSLNITGGTSPYNITWGNGQVGKTISNQKAGSYPVTVVDYYGDYTANTICNLFALTPTPTMTPTTSMTPTPTTVYPNLCFIYTSQSASYGPYLFVPNGVQNGKPRWTYGSYTILWSISSGLWEMTGWNNTVGIPKSSSSTFLPTSNWELYGGSPGVPYSISVSEGPCPTYLPISVTTSTTSQTCNNTNNCDGSITVAATGGLPPYQYSIDGGGTFQTSAIFNNLCTGQFSVIVKDSLNSLSYANSTFVGLDNTPQTYVFTIDKKVQALSANVYKSDWSINVSPSIPVGTIISFPLTITSVQRISGPFFNDDPAQTGTIESINSVFKNGVELTPPAYVSSTQVTLGICASEQMQVTTVVGDYSISMTAGDTIVGTSYSNLTMLNRVVGGNSCISTLWQDITVQIGFPSFLGPLCQLTSTVYPGLVIKNHKLDTGP